MIGTTADAENIQNICPASATCICDLNHHDKRRWKKTKKLLMRAEPAVLPKPPKNQWNECVGWVKEAEKQRRREWSRGHESVFKKKKRRIALKTRFVSDMPCSLWRNATRSAIHLADKTSQWQYLQAQTFQRYRSRRNKESCTSSYESELNLNGDPTILNKIRCNYFLE